MSYINTLQVLTHALKQAAAGHHWASVQRVDTQIAAQLAAIRGVTLSAAERQALDELRQVHQQVQEYCRGQSEIIEAKMHLAVRNREGATAYAAFMNAEDLG